MDGWMDGWMDGAYDYGDSPLIVIFVSKLT